MTTAIHTRAVSDLEPAPAMYLFTGRTDVTRTRRTRYEHGPARDYVSDSIEVVVLAEDQDDAERIVGAMISTPADTPDDAYGSHIDKHQRAFTWTRVEHAPADAAAAETLRRELTRTVSRLDEARSDLRVSERQASDERQRGDEYMRVIDRVAALTFEADDGSGYEHNGHGPTAGEPECPGCWASSIRRALEGDA